MRLLLDTHIGLWALAGDRQLPQVARELLLDPINEVWVSAATIWEITIKYGNARGRPNDMPISGETAIKHFEGAGFRLLPILPAHAAAVGALPRHHGDPFDRLLVAQAIFEDMTLVTSDAVVSRYPGKIRLV